MSSQELQNNGPKPRNLQQPHQPLHIGTTSSHVAGSFMPTPAPPVHMESGVGTVEFLPNQLPLPTYQIENSKSREAMVQNSADRSSIGVYPSTTSRIPSYTITPNTANQTNQSLPSQGITTAPVFSHVQMNPMKNDTSYARLTDVQNQRRQFSLPQLQPPTNSQSLSQYRSQHTSTSSFSKNPSEIQPPISAHYARQQNMLPSPHSIYDRGTYTQPAMMIPPQTQFTGTSQDQSQIQESFTHSQFQQNLAPLQQVHFPTPQSSLASNLLPLQTTAVHANPTPPHSRPMNDYVGDTGNYIRARTSMSMPQSVVRNHIYNSLSNGRVGERVNKPTDNVDYRQRPCTGTISKKERAIGSLLSRDISEAHLPSLTNISTGKTYLQLLNILHVMDANARILEDFNQVQDQLKKHFNIGLLTSLRNCRPDDLEMIAQSNNYRIAELKNHMNAFPSSTLDTFCSTFKELSCTLSEWKKLNEIPAMQHNSGNIDGNQPVEANGYMNHLEYSNNTNKLSGESVSLYVPPIKPDVNLSVELRAQGSLHPELSLRPKVSCQHCGSTSTPEWRKGPSDAKTLCNACGLFHTKLVKKIGAEKAALELKKRRERGEQTNRRIY